MINKLKFSKTQMILSDGSFCQRNCDEKLERISIEPQNAQISKIEIGFWNSLLVGFRILDVTGTLLLKTG